MGDPTPERPAAGACERRPYTAAELMTFRDKVHKSPKWVALSEECPPEIIRSHAVSIITSSMVQSTSDNKNSQYGSSNDEDGAEPQGGVHVNIIRQPIKPPALLEVQRLSGFSRFVHDHISPIHARVTAGGRVVPAGPVMPPVTFTKPFLEEFIKATDLILQKTQRAQVVESDNHGVCGDLMMLQQVRRMNGSSDRAPAHLDHTVHGNPFEVRNPRGPKPSDETERATPEEEPTSVADELFHQLPGSQIVTVQPDGAIFVVHNGLLYRRSKMEGGRTRYDSVVCKDAHPTFNLGPGIVFESAQAPRTTGKTPAAATDGQTQSVNGQQALNPMLVLPPGAQLHNILANGVVIFLHDGKAKSARFLGDQTVYGEVHVPTPDLDLTHAQVHLPRQTIGEMQPMPPVEAMRMVGPMPTMPDAGFVAPEYLYPAPGFIPAFNPAQPFRANNSFKPQITLPVSTEGHIAYHKKMQALNMQLADTQSDLNDLDREWAQYGDERDNYGLREYSRLRGNLVNTVADIRQAIKRMESARPARAAFGTGEGPSKSGHLSRPQAKKKLSPEAPIFIPGFAGPSSASTLQGDPSARLRIDSTQSWTPAVEQQGIIPSAVPVLATSAPSRKGKEKAIEYSYEEIRTVEPVSVCRASKDDADEGSALEHLAACRMEHHTKSGGNYVPRPTRRQMLEHLHQEKPMADWVPFPDETLVEFFKAYTKHEWVFEKAKQLIKPESRIVFPGFYIPPERLAQLETPSQEDQTLGECSIAAPIHQDKVKQIAEKQPAAIDSEVRQSKKPGEIGKSSRSAENRHGTGETSSGNATHGKENVSQSQKGSVSTFPGNVLADVTNSARVVDGHRSSYQNAACRKSSGQTADPQTGELSHKPSATQVTPEQFALMNSIIAEEIDEKLQQQEVRAFINKITEAQAEDSNVRKAKIIERNVVTQQSVIDREQRARLELELAEHKRLVKEQERQLHRYQKSPHCHETTPQHRANQAHERHGPYKRPTVPQLGKTGYSSLVDRPEHGLPSGPTFDQGFRGQMSRLSAQLSNESGASNMSTPNHQRMGGPRGTPGRQQMGPSYMGRTQITPPHIGPPQMGQRQATPTHVRPPMGFQVARFSGPGNHGIGNPMMEQQIMQPMLQPRGPPQMGPEQMRVTERAQIMRLPQMMALGQTMDAPQIGAPNMGYPTMVAPPQIAGHFQAMARPQMMRAQYMGPPNMIGSASLAPPQMTAPPNMGKGQAMDPPPMMATPQMMGPAQLMAPPNVGPAQEMRPRQMGHARITSREARFIEQGNRAEGFGNHHMAPPMTPIMAFPPFEAQDIPMMDQRNHDLGNRQLGLSMGPPQLRPSLFDNGNLRGMDPDREGFGNPEMGGPPAWFGQMVNPIVRPAQFESQAARSIGRSRRRNHGNETRPTSPPMGPPNDDPSFLDIEDLRPVSHNRNHHNAFGPPPSPVAPQTSLPQTAQRQIQHTTDAPPAMGPGYMPTHSPQTTRSSGRRGPGFAINSQVEARYSTFPEDTPLSRRGANRSGKDQMMSNPYPTSPEDMHSSRRGVNQFIGNGRAAADRSSASQEEPRPSGRRQENFDQHKMSPFSARAVRSSRSSEESSPSHGRGIVRAGNVSAAPHDVQVTSEDRPHLRQLFPNFGPIGMRLPMPVFKFPDPAASKVLTHPRPSGHPGRPSITDEHFTPFLPGRDLF